MAILIALSIILLSIISKSMTLFLVQSALVGITGSIIYKKDKDNLKNYMLIYLIAVGAILLIYYGLSLKYGVPYYIGGSDDLTFEKDAFNLVINNVYNPLKAMRLGLLSVFHNSSFFTVYIAILVKISSFFDDYTTLLPRIINIHFLIYSCMILKYLLLKYTNIKDKYINIGIMIFALTPNILYINSFVFRDTLNLLQILLIVYCFDKILSDKGILKKLLYLIGMIFIGGMTYFTRSVSLGFALLICLVMLFEKFKINKLFLLCTLLLLVFGFNDYLRDIFGRYNGSYSEYLRGIADDGLSSFVFGQSLLPYGIVIRSVYALISPFPNIYGLFKDSSSFLLDFMYLLIYLGVVFQIVFIPFIIKRILKFDWLSLSFLVTFIPIIATTFTFRHAMIYYPFMVFLAIDGYLKTNKKYRKSIVTCSFIVGFGCFVIYSLIKFIV